HARCAKSPRCRGTRPASCRAQRCWRCWMERDSKPEPRSTRREPSEPRPFFVFFVVQASRSFGSQKKKSPEGQGEPSGREGRSGEGSDFAGCTQGGESTRVPLRAPGTIDATRGRKFPVVSCSHLSGVHSVSTAMTNGLCRLL